MSRGRQLAEPEDPALPLPATPAELLERAELRGADGDLHGVLHLLREAGAPLCRATVPALEARLKEIDSEAWWSSGDNKRPNLYVFSLLALAGATTAARTATLLRRRVLSGTLNDHLLPCALELIRARDSTWTGDLATRLAHRLRPREAAWAGEWDFIEPLFREAGIAPPATEAVARAWLARLHRTRHDTAPVPVADRLRASPYLDLLLPVVFEVDGMGAVAGEGQWDPARTVYDKRPAFPAALATLAAEGRLDRTMLLDSTLDRLVRGDKPGALRPFAALHDALAPTADEVAARALDYARLLPDSASPIAGLAQRALRTADDAGRLELETLLDASAPTLLRTEKTLVKKQLTWLEKAARRHPDRSAEIMETVAVAFGHPALDIQERALTIIGRALPAPEPDLVARLAAHTAVLSGDLRARAAALLGTELTEPVADQPLTLPPHPPVAAMPPAINTVDELAEELVMLVERETGVGWERVLAGLVTLLAAGERTALARTLLPLLERNQSVFVTNTWIHRPAMVFLGEAIRAAVEEGQHRPSGVWQRMVASVREAWQHGMLAGAGGAEATPRGVLALRLAELSIRLRSRPVPLLLSTPTHVTGSLDAEVLLDRLIRAENEGWEPWRFDLEQALVRVPRAVDPAVSARAATLTGEAGRRFAEWLATGGLPDPVATRLEQLPRDRQQGYGWSQVPRRVVVTLEPSAPSGLLLESRLSRVARAPYHAYGVQHVDDVWAMVLPHHRDTVAAWALPSLAELADADAKGGADILPRLAEASGPVGPAFCYALAYSLGARHEADRIAAVDAFLTLLARKTTFAAEVGAALGDLAADGAVKLSRVVAPLGDIHRAGGSGAVWELLAMALPSLLPTGARALPDLLELAAQVAPAARATGTFAQLDAVAGRTGASRLVREAKRLRDVLNQ